MSTSQFSYYLHIVYDNRKEGQRQWGKRKQNVNFSVAWKKKD